ncbi:hypothetical protein BC351_00505 [Paenibacillus ferrarius]|uniref:Uncharacterized protein n=1 Tax=Paenibacillus ferrarius TaxID=1469647 RepID=A0A1V4HS90_9BACL|nr:hypothetical protein [Paenibacillus ferrarius]OPH61757.1 hypothetical protein BC351_00505 [Paenibacillus ferrarius]
MSKLTQNDIEWLIDMVQRGELTADQANVEKVRMARVQVVSKLSSQVRKALNAAVKTGYLAHKKKEERKPEVYYHPDFEHMANEERNKHELEIISALAGIVARPYENILGGN